MTMSKAELAEAVRFAGERAAAAVTYVDDWEYTTSSGWTTREHFAHVASLSGHLDEVCAFLTAPDAADLLPKEAADLNRDLLTPFLNTSPAELARVIREGHEADAAFIEGLDEDSLAQQLHLGPYHMPLAELLAYESVNHAIYHVTEGTLRVPLA
jgi:hypothetical protein